MAAHPNITHTGSWRQATLGAAVTVALGWLLWSSWLGDGLTYLSYDLPVVLRPTVRVPEVVVVYLDETSLSALQQTPEYFDRRKHAEVLRFLTAAGAELVVYDVLFDAEHTPEEDEALAAAMREHGKVVIAATLEKSSQGALSGGTERWPLPVLRAAAAGVGVSVVLGQTTVVRRYLPGVAGSPSLPWAAARVGGFDQPRLPAVESHNHWINYYGSRDSMRTVRFADVTSQDPAIFRGKHVLIGSFPRTPNLLDEKDEFRVPYSRFGGGCWPGVDIWAHALANLRRGDWLERWSPRAELALLALAGVGIGVGLSRLSFRWALTAGLGVALTVTALGLALVWWQGSWCCWTLVAGAQVPVAIACACGFQVRRMSQETEILQEQLSSSRGPLGQEPRRNAEAIPARGEEGGGARSVADHTLLRRVGRGAYGEVWLARNAVGLFHAIKLVFRDAFDGEAPYEREFKGIEKFMPVSRSHPALVQVLHVGRNHREGWFYYVMEAADDLEHPGTLQPGHYTPKSLLALLRREGSLPAHACVEWMLTLADGLDHLHRHQLIHRDIKPANIIFVQDRPKLADIGLVTRIASGSEAVSRVGTEGYIAPEGPGSPQADLYGLGKVFYQACTGMDPDLFPELPTNLAQRPDRALLLELNRILGRACDSDPDHRFASGADLAATLKPLLTSHPKPAAS